MSSSKIVAVVGAWANVDSGAVPLIVLGTRAVLRAAFLLAQLDGFGTPVGGAGDGVEKPCPPRSWRRARWTRGRPGRAAATAGPGRHRSTAPSGVRVVRCRAVLVAG
jgi:hypothetical protein